MTTNGLTVHAPANSSLIEGERWFDAPVATVWRAYTEPDLLARWLGPSRLTLEIQVYDVRDGGRWAYVNREADGEYAFRGVFHTVEAPHRIVQTFEFLGAPGQVSLDSLELEEIDGRTRMRFRSAHLSIEARDAMVAAGMERGMAEGFEALDAVLPTLSEEGPER